MFLLLIMCFSHCKADITISAVGDIMLGNRLTGTTKVNPDALRQIMPYLKNSDINFANLEGPIGGQHPKTCATEHCHTFSQPVGTAAYLKSIGFNLISVANNHARDMGPSGMTSTESELHNANIEYAGYLHKPHAIFKTGRHTIGMLAYTHNNQMPDYRNNDYLKDTIKKVKSEVDFLIVSMHAGCEGTAWRRQPVKNEVCYGEQRGHVKEIMQSAVDFGADLVIGHGPHVPRGVQIYKHKLILWSLGNFATARGIDISGISGYAPLVQITYDNQLEIKKFSLLSFRQTQHAVPMLDSKNQAEQVMITNSPVYTFRYLDHATIDDNF